MCFDTYNLHKLQQTAYKPVYAKEIRNAGNNSIGT